MGYHPRKPMNYSGAYFEKYQAMDATDMGAALTKARVDLVSKYCTGRIVDIGIGGGRFVTECGADGYDVNPIPVTYRGQRLPSTVTLEIWNIDGNTTVDLEDALEMLTSILHVVTSPLTTTRTSDLSTELSINTLLAEPFPLTPFPLTFATQQTY